MEAIFGYISRYKQQVVLLIDKIEGLRWNDFELLKIHINSLNSMLRNPAIIIITTNGDENFEDRFRCENEANSILFSLPGLAIRYDMLRYLCLSKQLDIDYNFLFNIAEWTEGLTYSDLKNLLDRAYDIAQDLPIKEAHLLIATYTLQNTKLPTLSNRTCLFEYFFALKDIRLTCKELNLLAEETANFTIQDIEFMVENLGKFKENKSLEFTALDLYKGLYADQRIKLANQDLRKKLLQFFLENKKTELNDNDINGISFFAADNFSAQELEEIINNATALAKAENNLITIKHLVVSLYKELLKKSTPLEMRKFFLNNTARTDYVTQKRPCDGSRYILIQYFLENILHELSEDQIHLLVYQTGGLSWYSLGKFIEAAQELATREKNRKLNFDDFKKAAWGFNIEIIEPINHGILLSLLDKVIECLRFIKNFPKWITERRLRALMRKEGHWNYQKRDLSLVNPGELNLALSKLNKN